VSSDSSSRSIDVRVVASGSTTNHRRPQGLLIVRDEAAWQALLPDLKRALGSRLDPRVDWATEMVIGYVCGSRPAIQYRMRIEAVTATAEEVVVHVVEIHPTGVSSPAVCNPIELVALAITDVPVSVQVVVIDDVVDAVGSSRVR
jgi:hypothetical protein